MPTSVQFAAGVFGIVVGLAWVLWPGRMSEIQMKFRFFGPSMDDERTDTELLIGRIAGAVLIALGAAIVFGLIP